MAKAVWIIRDEHQRYAAVLNLVRHLLQQAGPAGEGLDADLVTLAFDYIEEFIDTFHHPKEDEFLFRLVRARSADAETIIATLEEQHKTGAQMLKDLRQTLLEWRGHPSEAAFAALKDAAEAYIGFESRHAMMENDELLPIAERVLTTEDWAQIDAAFEDNNDPAFGDAPKAKFQSMMAEIARRAPAPYGYSSH